MCRCQREYTVNMGRAVHAQKLLAAGSDGLVRDQTVQLDGSKRGKHRTQS